MPLPSFGLWPHDWLMLFLATFPYKRKEEKWAGWSGRNHQPLRITPAIISDCRNLLQRCWMVWLCQWLVDAAEFIV